MQIFLINIFFLIFTFNTSGKKKKLIVCAAREWIIFFYVIGLIMAIALDLLVTFDLVQRIHVILMSHEIEPH